MPRITRRTMIKSLATAGSAAALAPAFGTMAMAAGGRVVVGTWGGDYARLLTKNIEDPILKAKGIEVIQDQASDAPRRAKMLAEKRLPRGTVDIQGFSAANMFEMNEAGVLEPIDYTKLENAKNLLPSMKYPYGVGQIYSGKVVVYNPKLVPATPTSFRDAFDPKHGNKLGLIDIQYLYIVTAASLAGTDGKEMTNFDKAKEVLMAVKAAGARIYPSNEAFAQGLKTEEIAIGIMWRARAVQWQNAGIACQSAAPSEGIPAYISGFAIARNAPNKANAYAYLDAMLSTPAQEAFAVDMGFVPTVENAKVAPDLLARIGFTAEEQGRLKDLDYAYLAKNDSVIKEWWDKVFKA